MEQYISKAAVVAEIERLISNGQVKLQKSQENNDYENYVVWSEHIATCIKVLSLIDSIKVKDVDLEKEATKFVQTKEFVESKESPVLLIAKHFFELGVKVQK